MGPPPGYSFNLAVLGFACVGHFAAITRFALYLVNIAILPGVIAIIHILLVVKLGNGNSSAQLIAN